MESSRPGQLRADRPLLPPPSSPLRPPLGPPGSLPPPPLRPSPSGPPPPRFPPPPTPPPVLARARGREASVAPHFREGPRRAPAPPSCSGPRCPRSCCRCWASPPPSRVSCPLAAPPPRPGARPPPRTARRRPCAAASRPGIPPPPARAPRGPPCPRSPPCSALRAGPRPPPTAPRPRGPRSRRRGRGSRPGLPGRSTTSRGSGPLGA